MKNKIQQATGLTVLSVTRYKGEWCVKLAFADFLRLSSEKAATLSCFVGVDAWVTCGVVK